MPDSYPFPIYSGLLEPKHYKRIGSAIWLFLWCISSTTTETTDEDGVTWGCVHGNKPLKLSDLAEPFGDVNEKTIRRWIETLEKNEYIKVTRAPYGLIINVKKSKKRLDKNVRSLPERVDKNVQSDERDRTKMSELMVESGQKCPITDGRPDKNVRSNKDIITTTDTTTVTAVEENMREASSESQRLDIIETEYMQLHGRMISGIGWPVVTRLVQSGIPPDFIIQTMKAVYEDRKAKTKGRVKINCFSYYENPIREAWQAHLHKSTVVTIPQTTPGADPGTVAKGQVAIGSYKRLNRQEQRNAETLRLIKEAEERERKRTSENIFPDPERVSTV